MPGDHPSVLGYVAAAKKLAGRPILDLTAVPPPLRDAAQGERVPGIDVSHYQGSVDWQKVAAAGVKFVFIKATEGRRKPDIRFAEYWDQSRQAGLFTGAYHFLRPGSSGAEQARRFLNAVGDRYGSELALPPALDLEVAGLAEKEILAWLDAVRSQLLWTPLVYLNYDFASRYSFQAGTVGAFPLWFAQYPLKFLNDGRPREPRHLDKVKTWQAWAVWQYSETGKAPGIASEFVDLDVFNGSLNDFAAWRVRLKNAA